MPQPDWNDVVVILQEKLQGIVRDKSSLIHWLNNLKNSEDGQQLGICLTIDLLSGSLRDHLIATILASVNFGDPDARKAFGEALEAHPERDIFYFVSMLSSPSLRSDAYVNVLHINKFITCYAHPAHGILLSPDGIAETKRRYFCSANGRSMEDAKIWWPGRRGIVWVTSKMDYEAKLNSASPTSRASVLKDALGLTRPHWLEKGGMYELVAVLYPESFGHPCLQPTSLDVWWRDPGHFYLSYGEYDGWGRTQSCSGKESAMRERIHRGFEGLGDGFRAFYVGIVTDEVANRDLLLPEAYSRVEMILNNIKKQSQNLV